MNYLYITAYVLIIAIGFAQIIQVIADEDLFEIMPAQPKDNNHAEETTSEVNEGRKTVSVSTRTIESTSRPSPSPPVTDSSAVISESTIVTEPLPDDDASFESIRKQGKVYVDKTGMLEYLLDRGTKLFFFTRPRRFGKTLYAKMMKSFFRGDQPSLFEGLEIHRRGNIVHNETIFSTVLRSLKRYFFRVNNKWVKYPVIYLDLSDKMFNPYGTHVQRGKQFLDKLNGRLKDIAEEYNVDSARPDFGLPTLTRGLKKKFNLPVIILIDEYDAPVNTAIYEDQNMKLAGGIAKILNRLFSEIKANTEYLRFVWVTGVTKLGLSALESGPNSFVDVTLTKELAAVVGFTAEEMTSYFKSHIKVLRNAHGKELTEEKMMKKLIDMYDGYRFSFDSDIRVLNPISVLGSLRNKRLDNYWRATGSLTYIIQRMWEETYTVSSFQNIKESRQYLFQRRNPIKEQIPLDIYMLLTGYLRIDHYDEEKDVCELTYANKETKEEIWNGMRSYIPSEKKSFKETKWLTPRLRMLMSNPNPNITELIKFLNRIGFPRYYIALNDAVDEGEVTRRLLAILKTANLLSEETRQFFSRSGWSVTPEGDIDIVTRDLPINYVIEIKCGKGKKASSALDGIKQQIEYATKTDEKRISYREALGGRDRLYLLTIHFEESYGGNIDEWVFLPFTGNRLRFDELKASNKDLFDKVKSMISKKQIDVNYIVDFKEQ